MLVRPSAKSVNLERFTIVAIRIMNYEHKGDRSKGALQATQVLNVLITIRVLYLN